MAPEIEESARSLHEAVGADNPRRRSRINKRQIEMYRSNVKLMAAAGNWQRATPAYAVALWAWCHEGMYGVYPTEDMQPASFTRACVQAKRALDSSFEGNMTKMIGFVRWTWRRERDRRARDPNRPRLALAWQFSSAYVGDWRVATAGR